MKKFLVLATLAALAGCNSGHDETSTAMETKGDSTARTINSPYPVNYSSSFEMGDPQNAERVLTLWKAWDNSNLSQAKDVFADTVELHFADGSIIRSGRDSVLADAQAYRTSLGNAVSTVDAVTALKSTDKNESWALIWGKEVDTDNSGKADSFYLQETWRFNNNGKADLMYQFRAAAKPMQQ